MLIAYDSRTGNVKRFVDKLGMDSIQISEGLIVNKPFVLITFTTGFGMAPDSTIRFLESNNKLLLGVASSGNRNWGANFSKSADVISSLYGVPVLLKFELSGTNSDIEKFKTAVRQLLD